MPPGPRPGTGEGMSAASGTARTGKPRQWDGLHQSNSQHTPGSPFPLSPSGASGPVCLKDASGAAARPGFHPVLDPARPLATDMAATGKQEGPVQRAQHPARTPANHPLTRPRSFRDE